MTPISIPDRPTQRLSVLLILLLGPMLAMAASAQKCSVAQQPSATLLFPYFELPASDNLGSEIITEGSLSLISISNTSEQPVLTKVVVWSNCGRPVFDFNLRLDAHATQSLNLRQVLLEGRVPNTAPVDMADLPPECDTFLDAPPLEPRARGVLFSRLVGQPDPDTNLCFAEPPGEAQPIVGYITVDAVSRCSGAIRTPHDNGYFANGESDPGIASGDNVLAGDMFLVDEEGNAAQGYEAVSILADPDLQYFEASFYGRADDRLPLPTRYRGRFLSGGPFDGGTDLIVWRSGPDPHDVVGPSCEEACADTFFSLALTLFNEQGESIQGAGQKLRQSTSRLSLGTGELATETAFGSFRSWVSFPCRVCSPPIDLGAPNVIVPIYTAEGRFSASVKPVPVDSDCLP